MRTGNDGRVARGLSKVGARRPRPQLLCTSANYSFFLLHPTLFFCEGFLKPFALSSGGITLHRTRHRTGTGESSAGDLIINYASNRFLLLNGRRRNCTSIAKPAGHPFEPRFASRHCNPRIGRPCLEFTKTRFERLDLLSTTRRAPPPALTF